MNEVLGLQREIRRISLGGVGAKALTFFGQAASSALSCHRKKDQKEPPQKKNKTKGKK